MAFQFQAVAALSPVMMREFGVGLSEIGILIGLYLAPGIVIALPGAAIGRRLGDKRAIAGGMLLMIAGSLLMVLGHSWAAQMAGRVAAGTGGILLNVLMTKLVQDWFAGREIATAMAIYLNSWPVGIAVALLVLPAAADVGGYAAAGWTVTALIAVGLILFVSGCQVAGTAGQSGAARAPLSRSELAGILLVGLIWALFNGALGIVFGFGPAMLSERGWTLGEASSTTSLVLWLVAVGAPLGGVLADWTGRRDVLLLVGVLGFAAAMVAAAATGEHAVSVFAIMGLAAGLAVGPITSMPAEVLSAESRALGMGVYYTLFYAAAVAFPMLAGALADGAGTASATFLLGTGLLLACGPVLAIHRARAARRLAGASLG